MLAVALDALVDALHHAVVDAAEGTAVDTLGHLVGTFEPLDILQVELQGAVQVAVDGTGREGTVAAR